MGQPWWGKTAGLAPFWQTWVAGEEAREAPQPRLAWVAAAEGAGPWQPGSGARWAQRPPLPGMWPQAAPRPAAGARLQARWLPWGPAAPRQLLRLHLPLVGSPKVLPAACGTWRPPERPEGQLQHAQHSPVPGVPLLPWLPASPRPLLLLPAHPSFVPARGPGAALPSRVLRGGQERQRQAAAAPCQHLHALACWLPLRPSCIGGAAFRVHSGSCWGASGR